MPDFVNGQARCGMDNLEYHLLQRDHEYINSQNGVSPSTSSSNNSGTMSTTVGPVVMGQLPIVGQQVIHVMNTRNSSTDEAPSEDHDYYNEYERLQKELQPLNHRRNETTV